MSLYTSFNGWEYIVLEIENGNWCAFTMQKPQQIELRIEKGRLQAFKTLDTIEVEGWPSLECQSWKLESFVEDKSVVGAGTATEERILLKEYKPFLMVPKGVSPW